MLPFVIKIFDLSIFEWALKTGFTVLAQMFPFNPYILQIVYCPENICILRFLHIIIPTQCFYLFFGDFDWSVGKIK